VNLATSRPEGHFARRYGDLVDVRLKKGDTAKDGGSDVRPVILEQMARHWSSFRFL